MHEHLAVHINQLGAERTNLFRNQRAENLFRISRAGGVILERILVKQFGTDPISQYQTISRCAVVVGSREALIVQSARATGGDDDGFGARNKQLFCFHVHEHRAGNRALVVLDQFNRGRKIDHGNAAVEHFVPKRPHDFGTRIVLGRVHTLARGTAAVGRDHRAVRRFIKLYAKAGQPLNGLGRIANQFAHQFRLGGKMSAAECVHVVNGGRVVRLVGGLNAALCHHGVGIADPKFGDNHHVGAGFVRFNRSRRACTAAADDQHIHVIIHAGQIHVGFLDAAVGL